MDLNQVTLRDWERSLRAERKSPETVRVYLQAVGLLARHLDGDVLAAGPSELRGYLADLMGQRAPSTAAARFKQLQQFYKWAVREELIDASPMAKLRQPHVPEKPVPIVPLDDLRKLLKVCEGRDFLQRRDMAILRLMLEPGGMRRGEVTRISLAQLDLEQDVVVVLGKGSRVRAIPFGYKTGQAITRYLRVRAQHPRADSEALWLGAYGALSPEGLAAMVERRGLQAGIGKIHPHQLRHTAADLWLAESGGDETSAMRLFGWRSRQMLSRYGASNADARAHAAARRLGLGDRL
jgi:site-specific recombinase XerC